SHLVLAGRAISRRDRTPCGVGCFSRLQRVDPRDRLECFRPHPSYVWGGPVTGRDIAIRARGLCKAYRRYKTPFDAVLELATGRPRHTTHTVLNDINLDLHRGEIIGVLGRNGAGKSTLLKVITGTLDKTAGELEVNW
ncbi:MAG: ABC transporter ATP-binding protein, partial [Gammaproteobacteria bacterium]|nr:ABC transporter ATP-binding protein [Gammaproteobacteria bacterium]